MSVPVSNSSFLTDDIRLCGPLHHIMWSWHHITPWSHDNDVISCNMWFLRHVTYVIFAPFHLISREFHTISCDNIMCSSCLLCDDITWFSRPFRGDAYEINYKMSSTGQGSHSPVWPLISIMALQLSIVCSCRPRSSPAIRSLSFEEEVVVDDPRPSRGLPHLKNAPDPLLHHSSDEECVELDKEYMLSTKHCRTG